jgi:ATP-dependent RNA helicase DDX47/RRP3
METVKRRKHAHDAPKKKVVKEKAPAKVSPEPKQEQETEEESATLEEPSTEDSSDAPKKTFKELVCHNEA